MKNPIFAQLVTLALLSTVCPQSVWAQSPTPDDFNPRTLFTYSLAVQTDKKVLLGGAFSVAGGELRRGIARVNADGTLDAGFNPGADGSNPTVYSLAVRADGKILVGGFFDGLGGEMREDIVRLNADGLLDGSFNLGASNGVRTVVVQADGKILVGGEFTLLGGQPRNKIGRLHADGTLDSSFDPGASSAAYTLALQPDGRILVGGGFVNLGDEPRSFIGRLNADGTLDGQFNPSANGPVFCLALQGDNKILVGGSFTVLGGQPRNCIARLHEDGTLDSSFNPGASNTVYSLAVQTDGKILVSGVFTNLGGQPRGRIGRLHADGTLDSNFDPGASSAVYALALQTDGRILVGGDFSRLGGLTRFGCGRLYNTEPATQSLSYDGSTITWLRGGTSPEVWRTTFELWTNGTTWIDLGAGTRISGGWQLTGVSVPPGGVIRARGYTAGGRYNASSWFVETLWPPQPRLMDPHWPDPATFAFTLLAETNLIYRIDCSSDFVTWNEVLRLTNPPSAAPVELPVAPGQPRQFYRAVVP